MADRILPVTGNTDRTQPENRAFYPALDGLRAIAFLMVFGQHYVQLPWGWTGVDVFFVLSGFLITGILYDSRNDTHRARNFYVRRMLRIFPLYYGCILLLVLLYPLLHWQWNARFFAWPLYLGNLLPYFPPRHDPGGVSQDMAYFWAVGSFRGHQVVLFLGHFWSLCIEEQFYLLWPWVVFLLRDRRKLVWICAASLPVCLLARLIANATVSKSLLDHDLLYGTLPFRLDALLGGGLLALLLRGPARETLLDWSRRLAWPALAALAAWFLLTPARHVFTRPYGYGPNVFTGGLTTIDLLSGLVLLLAIQPRTRTFRLLRLRPLRWLGRLSYGAYVLHDIPHTFYNAAAARLPDFLTRYTRHSVWSALFGLVGTLVLATLSFRYIETPFLNLKDRWTLRDEAKETEKAAVVR